ncbi:calcium-binding protein [Kitasatospora sp. NPDC085879]|uniref:calcium-binding protein n=1 Tax=Kitasatospora sp. NPDC085879 TaxID=3154769 RepID=UPI00341B9C12
MTATANVWVTSDGVVHITTPSGHRDQIEVAESTRLHDEGGVVEVMLQVPGSSHLPWLVHAGPGCEEVTPGYVLCSDVGRRLTGVRVDAGDRDDSITFSRGTGWGPSGLGSVTVVGGSGADQIYNRTPVRGILNGGDGNDTIVGGSSSDLITGGAGNDTLIGGDGDDDLFGEIGDDVLYGEGGRDRLDGGVGHANVLNGGSESDTCNWAGPEGRRYYCEAGNGS